MSTFEQFKQSCLGSDPLRLYQADAYRLVETQEFAATTGLVDDLDEQFLLEQMLDDVKPKYRQGTEHMHYLLKTPFRYPPLKHGSRFGKRTMESFFYASEEAETALAEVAYYRFIFLSDMETTYQKAVRTEHLMFSVKAKSHRCIDLSSAQFDYLQSDARDPQDYRFCQSLGLFAIEQLGADTIRYRSARAEQGINVAIFEPAVICSGQPQNQHNWLCLTHADSISFTQFGGSQPITFKQSQFLVDGQLPRPA